MTSWMREIAVPHEAWDGKVIFWMIPYDNTDGQIALEEMERLEPQGKWVHKVTHEERFTDPEPTPIGMSPDDPILKAQREASEWEYVNLWSTSHRIFALCVPLTVDIEFKGKDKELPAQARGLKTYWKAHNGKIADNWPLYRQLVGYEAAAQWMSAYTATRDTSFDGPEALQQEPEASADPKD